MHLQSQLPGGRDGDAAGLDSTARCGNLTPIGGMVIGRRAFDLRTGYWKESSHGRVCSSRVKRFGVVDILNLLRVEVSVSVKLQ